ncbi:MAG: hypothetical protein D6726_12590 [Nitrospirae bacterium]|nr:MAG: hypothetical protein D6726_12590 [Nitrospirota bacterium]
MGRLKTGVQGLDEILGGGLQQGSSYMIVGGPGTGKTILSLQICMERVREGERPVYIAVSEPLSSVKKTAESLMFNIDGIVFEDVQTYQTVPEISREDYDVFHFDEVEARPVWEGIWEVLERHKPSFLVIDSATVLHLISADEYQFRRHFHDLINRLSVAGCTSLFLYDSGVYEQESSVAIVVDSVIRLRAKVSEQRVITIRTLEVEKARYTHHMSGFHAFRITGDGVKVYPHHVLKQPEETLPGGLITSRIDGLDELLGGGLETGTCTILTGPTGVGKSTLAVEFGIGNCRSGKRTVIYTFEESKGSMLERQRGIGSPIDKYMETGHLSIRHVNPLELYPDEFFALVEREIESGCELVVLDSLRGYELSMGEFGNLRAHIQNLVNLVRRKGKTLIMVNEVEKLTGVLQITELGTSYLSDIIIMLRYAEVNGEIIKVVSCIKKRHSGYLPELRRFNIDERGITVGEKMENMRGVLTGIPTFVDSNSSQNI